LEGGSAIRKASTYTGQHHTKKRGYTGMPGTSLELANPEFEQSQTIAP